MCVRTCVHVLDYAMQKKKNNERFYRLPVDYFLWRHLRLISPCRIDWNPNVSKHNFVLSPKAFTANFFIIFVYTGLQMDGRLHSY
jgi:hypothetical protein